MKKNKRKKSKILNRLAAEKKGVPLQEYIQQTKGKQIARGMKARKDKDGQK